MEAFGINDDEVELQRRAFHVQKVLYKVDQTHVVQIGRSIQPSSLLKFTLYYVRLIFIFLPEHLLFIR